MNARLSIMLKAFVFIAFVVFCLKITALAYAGPKRIHASLEIYDYEQADKCDNNKMQIRITTKNITPVGIVTLEVYDDPDNFLDKKGRLRRVRVPAQQSPQTICINVNKTGRYAVAGYHDIDANRKLKKSFIKVPREPFALSNNPKFKKLRFPKFSDSTFFVGAKGENIILEFIDIKKQKKLREQAEKLEKSAQ